MLKYLKAKRKIIVISAIIAALLVLFTFLSLLAVANHNNQALENNGDYEDIYIFIKADTPGSDIEKIGKILKDNNNFYSVDYTSSDEAIHEYEDYLKDEGYDKTLEIFQDRTIKLPSSFNIKLHKYFSADAVEQNLETLKKEHKDEIQDLRFRPDFELKDYHEPSALENIMKNLTKRF